MNSKGGTLLIGVDPHKVLVGLQNDFRCLGKNNNWDGWNLHLTNLIRDHIGNRFSTYISVRPRSKDSKTVAEIRLEKSSDPVWITYYGKDSEKKTEFYIRANIFCNQSN